MKELEHLDDPTKAKREEEIRSRIHPLKKLTQKDKWDLRQKPGNTLIGEQFGSIQDNGFISKTLTQVQLGQKSKLEWLGEEFLLPEPKPDEDPAMPHYEKFPYSIIAHTKCVTYRIKEKSFNRIP